MEEFDFPIYFSPSGLRQFDAMMKASFPEKLDWTARFNAIHVPTLRFEDYMENKNRYSRRFLENKKRENESRRI
jgi:hypothetical protein